MEEEIRNDDANMDYEKNNRDMEIRGGAEDTGSDQPNKIDDWAVDSLSHAAPTVTMDQYEKIIINGFMNAPLISVKGIVDAYGLSHKQVIEELVSISEGNLKIHLDEEVDQWMAHGHVSHVYWDSFERNFPAIAETLTINFQARSITGTPVEQAFCQADTQIRANQSADTNAKNMNHALSVKGAIIREMRNFEDAHKPDGKRRRKHQLRSTGNQSTYLRSLRNYGEKLANSVRVNGQIKVQTIMQMRANGKKIMELKKSLPHTLMVMTANAPRGEVKICGETLFSAVKDSTLAKRYSYDNMPVPEVDKFEVAAKKLGIATLRKILKQYYEGSSEKCKEISKMPRGDSSDAPNSLMNLLVVFWRANFADPPEILPEAIVPAEREYNFDEKRGNKMSVQALRKVLIANYAGDDSLCARIQNLPKGNPDTPNTLVHMICALWLLNSA